LFLFNALCDFFGRVMAITVGRHAARHKRGIGTDPNPVSTRPQPALKGMTMTKKPILAATLALGLALSATPAMAQSAQPAEGSMTIASNPIQILIGMLLPAVQKVR